MSDAFRGDSGAESANGCGHMGSHPVDENCDAMMHTRIPELLGACRFCTVPVAEMFGFKRDDTIYSGLSVHGPQLRSVPT